jgi:translation initiation factor IF-3
VRLVGADGAQIGIKPLPEALTMARELELDLVEVADKANPPVCRIMDYGKYKYEAAQRAKESRKKSTNVVVKEMKYRPKIGAGDFDTKTKKVEHFLSEGHKVKVTIMFRGREMQHPELGRKILDHVAEAVADQGRVEVYPRLDGRNMTMVLGPDKKAQAAAEKRRQAENEESAPTPVAESEESTPAPAAETEVPTAVAAIETEEPTSTAVAAEASPDSDTTGV